MTFPATYHKLLQHTCFHAVKVFFVLHYSPKSLKWWCLNLENLRFGFAQSISHLTSTWPPFGRHSPKRSWLARPLSFPILQTSTLPSSVTTTNSIILYYFSFMQQQQFSYVSVLTWRDVFGKKLCDDFFLYFICCPTSALYLRSFECSLCLRWLDRPPLFTILRLFKCSIVLNF